MSGVVVRKEYAGKMAIMAFAGRDATTEFNMVNLFFSTQPQHKAAPQQQQHKSGNTKAATQHHHPNRCTRRESSRNMPLKP